MLDLLKKQLEIHEGRKLVAYNCSAGVLTIGIGHNCIAFPTEKIIGRAVKNLGDKINDEECDILFKHDIKNVLKEATMFPFYSQLSTVRQVVICDMLFNLGVSRFNQFLMFKLALNCRDFEKASVEMLDSKWASQVGKRSKTLARQMRTNNF